MVHQCTKFGCKKTQHRLVTCINNNKKYLLPEAVYCCLQSCHFSLMYHFMLGLLTTILGTLMYHDKFSSKFERDMYEFFASILSLIYHVVHNA